MENKMNLALLEALMSVGDDFPDMTVQELRPLLDKFWEDARPKPTAVKKCTQCHAHAAIVGDLCAECAAERIAALEAALQELAGTDCIPAYVIELKIPMGFGPDMETCGYCGQTWVKGGFEDHAADCPITRSSGAAIGGRP
jgi:hypothetical protein